MTAGQNGACRARGPAGRAVCYILCPREVQMDTTVEVTLPVDAEAAKALNSPARREAAGRYLSGLLTGGTHP